MMHDAAQRKQALLLRSRDLRAELDRDALLLTNALDSAQGSLRILSHLRRHPEWLVSAAIGVLLLRPSRLATWTRGLAFGLRTGRQLRPLLAALRSRA